MQLSETLTSAAQLLTQADQLDDEQASATLKDAARILLKSAGLHLTDAPGPAPDPADEDDDE